MSTVNAVDQVRTALRDELRRLDLGHATFAPGAEEGFADQLTIAVARKVTLSLPSERRFDERVRYVGVSVAHLKGSTPEAQGLVIEIDRYQDEPFKGKVVAVVNDRAGFTPERVAHAIEEHARVTDAELDAERAKRAAS